MSCKIHIITCSMMSQRGGEKWQKILWRDTPIIMNDGQAISWYAKVLFVAVCMSSYSLFLYYFCSFFPIISCWCYLKVSMIVFWCCNCWFAFFKADTINFPPFPWCFWMFSCLHSTQLIFWHSLKLNLLIFLFLGSFECPILALS